MTDRSPKGLFIGLTTLDIVYYVTEVPGVDEKVQAESQLIIPGGPAANAAVTFALLGGEATLLTKIGTHAISGVVGADLASVGVAVIDVARTVDVPLPMSSVCVDTSGRRSVVSLNGQAFRDAAPPLPSGILPRDAHYQVVVCDGHYLDLVDAVISGIGSETPVVLDAGSRKPGFDLLLGRAHSVIASSAFVGSFRTVDEVLRELAGSGADLVAISRGGEPIEALFQGLQTRIAVAVASGEVVDTLGAGDVLHGAYAYYLAGGSAPDAALVAAADVASRSTRWRGPRKWGAP